MISFQCDKIESAKDLNTLISHIDELELRR